MQIWRYLFAGSAVLFVIGVVVQILLAGWGIAGLGGQGMRTYIDFGYTLSLVLAVPLLLSWPARAGRQTIAMCAALLVLTFVQTLLPGRDDLPWISALHSAHRLRRARPWDHGDAPRDRTGTRRSSPRDRGRRAAVATNQP